MKRGFTLVELIATLTIVVILGLIGTTSVTRIVNNYKQDSYETQMNYIKESYSLFINDNEIEPFNKEFLSITLYQLKQFNYVDKEIKNPIDNTNISDDTIITLYNNNYNHNIILETGTDTKDTNFSNIYIPKDKLLVYLNLNDTVVLGSDIVKEDTDTFTYVIEEVTYNNGIILNSVDSIDTTKFAKYRVTYTINGKKLIQNYVIKDYEAPAISFDNIKCSTTLTNEEAVSNLDLLSCVSATDNDGNIVDIMYKGRVVSENGIYYITYIATDTSGNKDILRQGFEVSFITLPGLPVITYENLGDEIYYNPVSNEICDTYVEDNSTSEVVTGCLKWHVLSENDDRTVNLLLDHNIESGVAWYTSSNSLRGPLNAVSALKKFTSSWNDLLTRTDSYTHRFINGSKDVTYTVNYDGVKARLPKAKEIADAVGKTPWEEYDAPAGNYFYFDSKTQTRTVGYDKTIKTSSYDWLFNNLGSSTGISTNPSANGTCLYYGCTMARLLSGNQGYWTSTAVANQTAYAWHVFNNGHMGSLYITSTTLGIRPVITLNLGK